MGISLWIIGAVILLIAVWNYLVKPLTYWTEMGVPQTKPWILLGDTWISLFRKMSICDFIQWVYNVDPNSRYVGFYNFRSPVLLLRDPELIKQVAVKDFDSFSDHVPFIDPDADPLWSKSLLALRGERWREMRNVISPTFTSSKMKQLFALIVDTAENFVNYFHDHDDKVIELDMKDTYTRFANDVIATAAFGIKVDSMQNKNNTFYEMGKRISDTGLIATIKFLLCQANPKLFKYLGIRFLDSVSANYFHNIICETIKVREEKNVVRPDVINILLEARKSQRNETSEFETSEGKTKRIVEISNAEITSQAVIFFFAGFDTISTALCFGSYELALNKEVQDKLREEIVESAKKGDITYDFLQQMPYMDMVVSEMLRKWPPFPSTDRICTKTATIEPASKNKKAVIVREGDEIWFPVFSLHRDPKYFPDPEKFDPERFSEENKTNHVPYTYMPFGVGPRICIGNRFALVEIKALFFHLLLNYEIVPTKKTPIPLILTKDIIPSIEGGFNLGLKRIPTKAQDGNN